MASNKRSQPTDNRRELERRKRNKVNARRNAPLGKSKGAAAWLKVRRRVRRKLLDR